MGSSRCCASIKQADETCTSTRGRLVLHSEYKMISDATLKIVDYMGLCLVCCVKLLSGSLWVQFLLQAKLAFVRLTIPKIYHPFICGPFNQTVKDIMERTNSRINIPPPSVAKDELTIAGEKEGVMIAECEIKHIYETRVSLQFTVTAIVLHKIWQ